MNPRCTEVLEHIHLTPNQLNEAGRAHLAGCPACQLEAARMASYSELVAGARRALMTEPDLAPSRWVEIRSAIDAATSAPGWRAPLAWGLVATAAGAGVVWLMAKPLPPSGSAPEPAPILATSVPALPRTELAVPREPAPGISGVPVVQVLEGEASPGAFSPGGRLELGSGGLAVRGFGRHLLRFAPESRVGIVDWSQTAIVLDLALGKVTSDVERKDPSEVFEVRAGEARVRVVGTRFEVARAADGAVSVTVAHGLVAVSHPSIGERRLAEGETLIVPAHQAVEVDRPRELVVEEPGSVEPHRPRKTTVIERDFGDLSKEVPAAPVVRESTGIKDELVGVVQAAASGKCGKALVLLAELRKSRPNTADMLYLQGYCYYRQGKHDQAEYYFGLYRAAGSRGSWHVPGSRDEKLPAPREGQLAP
jgi:hypothetical protein